MGRFDFATSSGYPGVELNMSNYAPLHVVAVTALISHPDGRVLLIRNPRRGWEVPGGQVDEGESLLAALKREVLEEAGVKIQPGALTGIYHNLTSSPKLIFSFLGSWVSGDLITTAESLESEWVARDQVLSRITNPIIYERIQDMLGYSKRPIYRFYTTNPYRLLDIGHL